MTMQRSEDRHPAPEQQIGPARFQHTPVEARRTNVAASVGSALVLLLLVVGAPVALVWLGGVPGLPTSLPTREQLTATIGTEQVLSVLLWVVWIAWLQFTVCVVVELRSALSGVGLPARVPLAGPSQRVARTLVASVLLLVTAVGPATALTPQTLSGPVGGGAVAVTQVHVAVAGAVQAPAVAASGGQVVGSVVGADGALGRSVAGQDTGPAPTSPGASAGAEVGATSTAEQHDAAVAYRLGGMELDADEGAALEGKAVYVVQPPEGRYHDNLWDIAERTLGDGRRYQEIFDLNKGRVQPDGHELSLARLIYPSWLLVMPEDAVGVERVVVEEAPVAPAPVQDAGGVLGDQGVGSVGMTLDGAAQRVADGAAGGGASLVSPGGGSADTAGASTPSGPTPQQLVGAGLLAAGLLAAVEGLRRRRRTPEPGDEAVETEVALRVGARPDRVALLDGGLRRLAGLLRDAGGDLPGVYAAVVGDSRLDLYLAPARTDAPAPWTSSHDGATWSLEAADLGPTPVRAPAPCPGLVSVGQDANGADVLIDLEAAQGPVAVVGNPAIAAEVATALAAELATNRWSDGLRVTGYGLPTALSVLDGQRYRTVDSVEDALPSLRDRRVEGAPDALGAGVLTGRLRGSGLSAWAPEYLVLGRLPGAETAARLVEASTTQQRSPLGVVCVGDLPGARWRLEVNDAGGLAVRVLGVQVQANRLGAGRLADVAELLTATVDDPATRTDVEHEPLLDRPAVQAPDPTRSTAELVAAPVRVRVLGVPRVETSGVLDAERVALATELVVHLALNPDGVHPTVLAAELWPRGVTAAVREATVERTRSWLGSDSQGTPHLRESVDGRLQLGPDVVLDWDVVRSLLAASRGAGAADERRLLAEALRLSPTAVLAERADGRYSWLARARVERSSRELLVDAAHRLVQLCRDDGDPGAARAAAEAGLRVAPTEELLWRDLMRAAAVTGGPGAVRQVAADLERTRHDLGAGPMGATTSALLTELVPGTDGARGLPHEPGATA